MDKQILKQFSKRKIAIKANVHPKTLDKYINNESINYDKEMKIKTAVLLLIEEKREIDSKFSNL